MMTWWWLLALALQFSAPDRCESELVELDRLRALAFATGDASGLDGVYVSNSPLLEQDRRTIERYRQRGGRVLGASLTVTSCRVLSHDDTTSTLEIVDVLSRSTVQWDDGTSTRLPTDRPTRRRVMLQLTDAGWRISTSVE